MSGKSGKTGWQCHSKQWQQQWKNLRTNTYAFFSPMQHPSFKENVVKKIIIVTKLNAKVSQQMMNYLTQHQAAKLADLVASLRPDWGVTGIMAALARNHAKAPAHIVTTALINIAANPNAITPGLLDHEGPHWEHARGTILAAKPRPPVVSTTNDPWCTDHPQHRLSNCPGCRPHKTPMPPEIKAQLKASLRGEKP